LIAYSCGKPAVKTPSAPSANKYSEDLGSYQLKFADPIPLEQIVLAEKEKDLSVKKTIGNFPTDNAKLNDVLLLMAQSNFASNVENSYKTAGYKLQLYSGKREIAQENLRLAVSKHPELKPEIRYEAPNFKVRAGNFMSKLQAYQVYQDLILDFPQALILEDEITIYLNDYK
jgi:hypothetical protein